MCENEKPIEQTMRNGEELVHAIQKSKPDALRTDYEAHMITDTIFSRDGVWCLTVSYPYNENGESKYWEPCFAIVFSAENIFITYNQIEYVLENKYEGCGKEAIERLSRDLAV